MTIRKTLTFPNVLYLKLLTLKGELLLQGIDWDFTEIVNALLEEMLKCR